MAPKPTWLVSAPWSLVHPVDHPLTANDLKSHDQLLSGHGPNDQALLLRCGKRSRCALPYIIPQSNGMTSRLVMGWAFVAPLVAIAELTENILLNAVRAHVPDYNPFLDVVVSELTTLNEDFTPFFHTPNNPAFKHNEVSLMVLRVRSEEVAVAPEDTPVYSYNESFDGLLVP